MIVTIPDAYVCPNPCKKVAENKIFKVLMRSGSKGAAEFKKYFILPPNIFLAFLNTNVS